MRRLFIASLALAVLAPATVPSAQRPFWLDSYKPGDARFAGPARSQRVPNGKPYIATVRGTFADQASAFRCGRPEPRPIYPSPGRRNGRVNADAVFIFAQPVSWCRSTGLTPPGAWVGLQVAVGHQYRVVVPLGGIPAGPARTHTYRFPLVGAGRAAKFRLPDRPTRDNYGRLRIVVRPAPASSCARGRLSRAGFRGDRVRWFARS